MQAPPSRESESSPDATIGPSELELAPGSEADRLLAGVAYLFAPITAWIVFLFARSGAGPGPGYRRYHARQAIVFGLLILVFELILAVPGTRTLAIVGYLVPLALQTGLAFKAYTADVVFAIPYVTPLTRRLFPDFAG